MWLDKRHILLPCVDATNLDQIVIRSSWSDDDNQVNNVRWNHGFCLSTHTESLPLSFSSWEMNQWAGLGCPNQTDYQENISPYVLPQPRPYLCSPLLPLSVLPARHSFSLSRYSSSNKPWPETGINGRGRLIGRERGRYVALIWFWIWVGVYIDIECNHSYSTLITYTVYPIVYI